MKKTKKAEETKTHMTTAEKLDLAALTKGWKQRTIQRLKLKPGETVSGKYCGTRERTVKVEDRKTKKISEKVLTEHILETRPDYKVSVTEDAGLRAAMNDAQVKEKENLLIVKREMITLTSGPNAGKPCNQYEIYTQ